MNIWCCNEFGMYALYDDKSITKSRIEKIHKLFAYLCNISVCWWKCHFSDDCADTMYVHVECALWLNANA